MAAGIEVFADHGFEGATTEAIARRAGVNKAMISYHFGGKRALYAAILTEHFSPLASRLEALAREPLPPDATLRQLLETLGELHTRLPRLPAMILREVLTGGEHLDERALGTLVSAFGFVREILERGVRSGAFRSTDPLLTHLVVMGSVIFFFATEPFRRRLIAEGRIPVKRPPTPEAFLSHFGDLLTRALKPDPEGRRRSEEA